MDGKIATMDEFWVTKMIARYRKFAGYRSLQDSPERGIHAYISMGIHSYISMGFKAITQRDFDGRKLCLKY